FQFGAGTGVCNAERLADSRFHDHSHANRLAVEHAEVRGGFECVRYGVAEVQSAAEAVLERVSSNDVGLYGYTVADQSACCVYAVAGRRIVRQRGECTGCVPHSFEMLPAVQYAMLEHLRNSR